MNSGEPKQHSSNHEFIPLESLSMNKIDPNAQLANLKSIIYGQYDSGTASSPTQANMLTINFPITNQQRQQISDRTYRSRESRRNSNIIEGPKHNHRRRLSQQKDSNTVFPNQRQRTLDSVNDVASNDDCT